MKRLLIITLFMGLFACERQSPVKSLILTSIFPLQDLIGKIAGNDFQVHALIKGGDSPHTYNPDTEDAKLLEKAAIFLRIGLSGMEMEKNVEKFLNPEKTKIRDLHDGIPLLPFAGHALEHSQEKTKPLAHHTEGNDPHIWLSPRNARQIIKNIKHILSELYPQQQAIFHENYMRYDQELTLLDQEISELLKPLQNRSFVEFHPAWTYFAHDYQLTIAGTIQAHPGHEDSTSLREIKELMIQAKKMRARAVFIEPQFNPELSRKVAGKLKLSVALLDPLGGDQATDSYVKLMRYNTRHIIEALQ